MSLMKTLPFHTVYILLYVFAAIFANILFTTTFDPVGGIVDLVNAFLGGGLAGLLGLMVFASFSK